jgi:hypothetical protein
MKLENDSAPIEVPTPSLADLKVSSTVATIYAKLANDRSNIPGYAEFGNNKFLGIDLESAKIVCGDSSLQAIEDKFLEKLGPDYSLRYTIVEQKS